MSGGMRLVCLGCGDAFSALYYSSCVAVEADGSWIVIDCPHPIRKILREGSTAMGQPLDIANIEACVVTHLHADHASGLEGMAFYTHYELGKKARLAAHPDVTERLWEEHLRLTMAPQEPWPGSDVTAGISTYFEITALNEMRATRVGPFEVECRRTVHPIPTFALRVRGAGAWLGYSSDTSFDEGLIEWLEPADLIVHETNLGIHTPYEALVELPATLRRKMRLIHYPDAFDISASAIEPLRQGGVYEIVERSASAV
jgi:ribonuclease BN (tRNA processing enzyme)